MIWPGGEVKLSDLQLVLSTPFTLHGDKEHTKIAIAFTTKQHEIFTQYVTAAFLLSLLVACLHTDSSSHGTIAVTF